MKLQIASALIAGYDLLSAHERSQFEKTEHGDIFSTAIAKAEGDITKLEVERDKSWFRKAHYQKQIDAAIEALRSEALTPDVTNSEEYKQLIFEIILKILPKIYPDIKYLAREEQFQVASAEFSATLQTEYLQANKDVESYQSPFIPSSGEPLFYGMLEGYKDSIIEKWKKQLATDETMSLIRTNIALGKGQERSNALAVFFPFLKDPRLSNPTSPAAQLYNAYQIEVEAAEAEHRAPNTEKVEEDFLTKLLFQQLQAKAGHYIDALQIDSHNLLDEFNQAQANILAKKILDAFNKKKPLEMLSLLDAYQADLKRYLRTKIELINGKRWSSPILNLATLTQPLSALWNNWITDGSAEFAARVGEAHSFLQYMGAASQNDNPLFWGLDAYNVLRNRDQIIETKNTLFGLLIKPFKPLIQEYQDIAKYETSFLKQILRTVMPLLIVAGLLVLVGMLLTPFGLPELAFLAIAIPTLFIGLALATKYVTWKNSFSQSFHRWWHGGPYEIPELKVSDRMVAVFGDQARLDAAQSDQEKEALLQEFRQTAETIRVIYIEEMQKLNENEVYFATHEAALTAEEIKARRDNLAEIYALGFEWYDIHSNTKLGIDVVKAVAIKRLCKIADNDYSLLKEHLLEAEGALIDQAINNLVSNLSTSLLPDLDPSVGPEGVNDEDDAPVFNNGRAPQVSLVAERTPLAAVNQAGSSQRQSSSENARSTSAPQPSATNPLRLFSLKCVKEHEKVKKISEVLEEIKYENKEEPDSSQAPRHPAPYIGLI